MNRTVNNTLIDAFYSHVHERGEKVFTRHISPDGVEELTFREFAVRSEHFARSYHTAGVGAGDVVLIFLPTSPDTFPAFLGAMLTGAIPSFMPCPSPKQDPLSYWRSHHALLKRVNPCAILTDNFNAAQMRNHGLIDLARSLLTTEDVARNTEPAYVLPPGYDPDQVAFLQHSSGTTSLKKGVMLTHRAVLAQIASYAGSLKAAADDNVVSWLPVYHDMGLIACSIMPMVLGQTISILNPFHWVARPALLFEAIEAYDGHLCWLPNFAFEHLARTVPHSCTTDLSQMRSFINCSEPCKPETFERFLTRFSAQGVRSEQLQVCYAMAETVFAVSQTAFGRNAKVIEVDGAAIRSTGTIVAPTRSATTINIMSAGHAISGIDVEISGASGKLGDGLVGEIVVSGSFLFDGYLNDSPTTNERLRGGKYYTRDLGFILDGELFVLGRKDDLLIINGRNLYAHEVEALAAEIAGLRAGRTVAFGVFSERVGSEELVVVAEVDGGAHEGDIARQLRDAIYDQTGIEAFEVRIVEPGWLIKTTSGKISREQNRSKWLEQQEAERSAENVVPRAQVGHDADTLDAIRRIVSKIFHIRPGRITESTVAADVRGWDSLAHATVVLEIEQALSIKFADDEIFGFGSVADLVVRAAELRRAGAGDGEASRIVYDSEKVSIVAFGEEGHGPDLLIFAGMRQKFGGRNLMDFASTLANTKAKKWRKFFITDKTRSYYPTAESEIAPVLNDLCPGPKIVLGNSMGGYGALKTASYLKDLEGVLAFVPVYAYSKVPVRRKSGLPEEHWDVTPVDGIHYCVLFGEVQDQANKAWAERTFNDRDRHAIYVVPNVGHRLVGYLDGKSLLGEVLECALNPREMNARVKRIVESIQPSAAELRSEVLKLGDRERPDALAYVEAKERSAADAAH